MRCTHPPPSALIEIGAITAAGKERHVDRRREAPGARTFTKEISEPIAGSSAGAGQLNTREESCPRRSDVGVGCP